MKTAIDKIIEFLKHLLLLPTIPLVIIIAIKFFIKTKRIYLSEEDKIEIRKIPIFWIGALLWVLIIINIFSHGAFLNI